MTDEADHTPLPVLLGYDLNRAIQIANDDKVLAQAYQRVFGTTEGRAVLFDILRETKGLDARPSSMPAIERAHHDGVVALGSYIFDRAGVSSIERVAGLQAAATVQQTMERAHERPHQPGASAVPVPGSGSTDDGSESQFADD